MRNMYQSAGQTGGVSWEERTLGIKGGYDS
jgi:hypothetical protein